MNFWTKVYDLVLKYHGSITAEHNDGIIRTPYLKKMYGKNIVALFKKLKISLILKMFLIRVKKTVSEGGGGTKEYMVSHIALEHKIIHKV